MSGLFNLMLASSELIDGYKNPAIGNRHKFGSVDGPLFQKRSMKIAPCSYCVGLQNYTLRILYRTSCLSHALPALG